MTAGAPHDGGAGALGAALAWLQPALADAQARFDRLEQAPGADCGADEACTEVLALDGAVLFTSNGLAVADGDDSEPQLGRWLRHGGEAAREAMAAARAGQAARFQAGGELARPGAWEVTVSPLRAADGAVDALLVVSRPAGAQAGAAALQDALERLDVALHAGPVIGAWAWDVQANRMAADARVARAFSLDPARAGPGLPLEDFLGAVAPADRARVAAALAQAARPGGRLDAELRLMQPDGGERWVQALGHCQADAAGRAVRLPGVLVDVHARVLAEAALRVKAERQGALLALGDGLRDAADPAAVADLAAALVGRMLGVTNVGYAEIDLGAGRIAVRRDWTDGEGTSIVGAHDPATFGAVLARLQQGLAVVEDDLRAAVWLSPSDIAGYHAVGIRALVNLPLLRGGRLVGAMFVGCSAPRAWTAAEVRFIHDVADRAWAAIERVQGEAALRASDAELRLVADHMPVMISFIDPAFVTRFINRASQAWHGLAPEQVVGRTVADIVGAEGLAWRMPYMAAAQAGQGSTIEADWPERDGTPRVAEIRYLPRLDAQGGNDGFYAFVLDVTARKRVEQALQGSAEALGAEVLRRTADRDRMWRLSSDIMLVARFDGVIEAVNPAWTALLGWREDELVGASFLDLVHPDDAAATAAEARRLAQGNRTAHFENRFRHQDGSMLWISWSAAPDERVIHAVGRDVTAAREAEALRGQIEEQLRQSQKMEAVGQLTGGLAHDFNNLLTGIAGSLELLRAQAAGSGLDGLDRYIAAAEGAASRAAALTHRLLAFSRRQALDPKPTSVNRLVAGMAELVQRTAGPAIQVETALGPDPWPTLCDSNQLENALLNLCINARDAMPEGGRLTVGTANAWLDAQAAQERGLAPGPYVALSVGDTGAGMAPEVAARAFDPFFTTKPIGEGTGLGLSMIYGFARQSGGQVRIRTAPGQGTTMTLYLPRHAGDMPPEPPAAAPSPPRAGQGETVLVVDDEPVIRMLVTEVLERLGYVALEAGDGRSGLGVLESNPWIDLLITDLGLPGGMNGRQLADAARERRPALKVLFITGYAENAVLGDGPLGAGTHLMTKPFTMERLAAKVQAVLGGG